jgi:dolichol-phosphate mannosyltransferase
MTPSKISLVVPTYRERENILPLLAAVCPVLSAWDYELIFVDDDSPDETAEMIEEAIHANPRVHLTVRKGERGLAGAVIRGFSESSGNILGSVNADLSHDASIIPQLIRAIEGGAEMAVGSRRIPGGGFAEWPWHRKLGSDVATALTKRVLKLSLSDPMSGFYFLNRSVFDRCRSMLEGLGFKMMLELAVVSGASPIKEVPYVFKDRQHGSSKMSTKVVIQLLRMLWRLRMHSQFERNELLSRGQSAVSSSHTP